MKYKKLLIGVILLLILSSITFIILENKSIDKFYLDNKYYNTNNFINVTSDDINALLNQKATFILFSYNNYCSLPIPCHDIFEQAIKENNISILKISFEDLKKTKLYKKVKLAPSVIIIKNGKIIDYLKADKDSDLEKYQNTKSFTDWLNKYIILK